MHQRTPVISTGAASDRHLVGIASVTIAFDVTDEDLSAFFDEELFATDCCGGWLRGVDYDAAYGWLVYESVYKPRRDEEPQRQQAVRLWRQHHGTLTATLPGWHAITAAVAARAVAHGVWLYGATVLDKPRRSAALQMALFGEIRYS